MASSNQCHVRSWLVRTATDLEAARTLPQLVAALRSLRILWRSFNHHICTECQSAPEISKLARFVLTTIGENAIPDDRCIAELVGINLRASALLAELCPGDCADEDYSELAGNEPLPDSGTSRFRPVSHPKGMQHAGDVKLYRAQG